MSSDGKPAPRSFQIDALDGVRGLAVLFVFASHCSLKQAHLIPGLNLGGVGKSGVFLFFLLSSFLLTLPFVSKGREVLSTKFFANYWWRRFLRVYPLFTLYLLLALITTPLAARFMPNSEVKGVPFSLTPTEFLAHLLLLQGKEVTWSILVEFKYYFFLPLIGMGLTLLLGRRLWLSALAVAGLVALSLWIWPPVESETNDPRLGPYLPVFLIGSLLAVEYWNVQHGRLPRLPASLARVLPWALDGLAIAALVVVACMTPEIASLIAGQKVAVNAFHKAFLLYCLLWSCVLLACFHGHGWVRRFFEWQPLRFLGFISFSFYLLHVIVLKGGVFLADRLHLGTFPGLGWLIFLVTTLVSYASYRIVEKPLAQLRLPQRRAKPTPAPADPAATEQSVASKPTVPAEASV